MPNERRAVLCPTNKKRVRRLLTIANLFSLNVLLEVNSYKNFVEFFIIAMQQRVNRIMAI